MPEEIEAGISRDKLRMIFLMDNSGSMDGAPITQLNGAMSDIIEGLHHAATSAGIQISLHIIAFNTTPTWVIGSKPELDVKPKVDSNGALLGIDVKDDDVRHLWRDLTAGGMTETHLAIEEAMKALKMSFVGTHALHPVVILMTDGATTNPSMYQEKIEALKKCLAGNTGKEKVIRIAIGTGDYSQNELEMFASKGTIIEKDETKREGVPLVFAANSPTEFVNVINWTARSSMYSSSQLGAEGNNADIVLDASEWGV